MKPFPVLAVAALLLLGGCAEKSPWKPVDKDGVPEDRGTKQCQAQAKEEAGYSKNENELSGIIDDLFITCMRHRGY